MTWTGEIDPRDVKDWYYESFPDDTAYLDKIDWFKLYEEFTGTQVEEFLDQITFMILGVSDWQNYIDRLKCKTEFASL